MAGCWRSVPTKAIAPRWKPTASAGIDLLVANLYPFEQVAAPDSDWATTVENIDIGGPAMIRAAAKNHGFVAVATDPADYAAILKALEENDGALPLALRKQLAAEAFARTAAYDAAVSQWFAERIELSDAAPFRHRRPAGATVALRRKPAPARGTICRRAGAAGYGNRPPVARQGTVLQQYQRHRRCLRTRLRIRSRRRAAVAIIKHANPCGVAVARNCWRSLRQGARLRSASRPSAASSPPIGRSTKPRRPESARSSPKW